VTGTVSARGAADGAAGTVLAEDPGARGGWRWRWLAAGAAVVGVALIVAAVAGAFGRPGSSAAGSDSVPHTGTATVTRQALTAQTQVNATLADAGSYSLVNQATGTLTTLPATGQVMSQGQVAYRVSGSPVVLLYGNVPAYRDLSEGLTGPDVTELNGDLVALGDATAAELDPHSDVFSFETAIALEKLQARLDLPVTGELALGQTVFAPRAIQVTGLATGTLLGGAAVPGTAVLTATSTTPVVTVPLDAGDQSEVRDGQKVTITLPDGQSTPGVVSRVSTVAAAASSSDSSGGSAGSGSSSSPGSGSGSPTITVLVSPADPRALGTLNQAPVVVTITTGSVADAVVVPVDALLAQANGGYAVEVVSGGRHHLVAVTLGLFDDAAGLVQVTGTTLAPGQHVVVPAV
jgi:hypothetical protein